MALTKDPGVPGNDLRRAGAALMRTKQGKQRHVMNIPSLQQRQQQQQASATAGSLHRPHLQPTVDAIVGQQEDRDPDDQAPVQTETQRNVSEMAAFALRCSRQHAQFHAPSMLLGVGGSAGGGGTDATDGGGDDIYLNEEDFNRKRHNDQSLRRFFKEFSKVVESSDVLLEVVDARDPLGCRLLHMEKTIQSQWGEKKTIVIVLNKADLVEPVVVNMWIRHFLEEGLESIAFTASRESAQATARNASIAKLFALLRRIARGDTGARKSITVGTIGYPNVGKSSIINALKRKSVVGVANTPGFTTGNTEIGLRSDVRIIDCPGIVMPGEDTGDVVLRNAAKVESLVNPHVAVERLIARCDPTQLSAVYSIGTFANAIDFVKAVGIRRGRLRQGGVVDEEATARMILHDWNDGRIGYYTLPPTDDPLARATLKSSGGPSAPGEQGGDSRLVVMSAVGGEFDLQAERLPTFHLSATEPIGERKRQATHYNDADPADCDDDEDDDDDADGIIEDSDDDANKKKKKQRRR